MDDFELYETVIAESNGEYYTAKIIMIEKDLYKVHYNGWSSKYDSWVKKSDLIKMNDMNLALVKLEKNGKKSSSSSKKYFQHDLIAELNMGVEPSSPFTFPFLLKQRLIEDWYMINHCNQFVPLPRTPSIMTILVRYEEECSEKPQQVQNNAKDLIQSLLYYINTSIHQSVLYPAEMKQYNLIHEKSHLACADIYGAEHLLRLLFILPTVYSASELNEKDINMINDSLIMFLKYLMTNPSFFCSKEEYRANDTIMKKLRLLLHVYYKSMESQFVVSEVCSENTYSKLSPQRVIQCISVSEEGYIALAEKTCVRVINPYNHTIFFVPKGLTSKESEDSERATKKRKTLLDYEETGNKDGGAYCFVHWIPCSNGYSESSFLLTVQYSSEVKLWGIPYSYCSSSMEEIADLTWLIHSTSFYHGYCSIIRCCSCCMSDDGRELIIGLNNLLFVFSLEWKIDSRVLLLIQLESCLLCEEDITSLNFSNSSIFCGSITGHLRYLNLPANEVSGSSSKRFHGDGKDDDYESTYQVSKELPLYTSIYKSLCRDIKASDVVIVSSLLSTEHPLQSSITTIITCPNGLLLADGVHAVYIDSSSWKPCFIQSIPEGFYCAYYCDDLVYVITLTYQLQVYDLKTHLLKESLSLLPSLHRYCDFAILGCYPIPHLSKPCFLVLFYGLSAIRTTTIDYRYQYLSLQAVSLRQYDDWYPAIPLSPLLSLSSIQPNDILNDAFSEEQLHYYHIACCYLIYSKLEMVDDVDHLADVIVAVQRKLLLLVHAKSDNPLSPVVLAMIKEEKVDENTTKSECSCCKKQTVLNDGHTEWCPYNQIDNYCWRSLKPIVSTTVLLCPCCFHCYLEGAYCVLCNIRLIHSNGRPEKSIGRETINNIRQKVKQNWNTFYNCLFAKTTNNALVPYSLRTFRAFWQ